MASTAFTPHNAHFTIDESSQELGQENKHAQDFNRFKLTQRDLGSMSVIGTLTKVEHGKWGPSNKPACLLCFRFQFQKGNAKLFRFEKAFIVIEFQARPPTHPKDDPAVLRYGPKRLQSVGTTATESWQYTIELSATVGIGPVQAGPTVEFGRQIIYDRHYAETIESDDWGNRRHSRPNCVRIWLREDEKQKDGIPLELLACVVVETTARSFQANVSVKVDSFFNLIAWPWSKDDPLLLEPGVNFGTPIREKTGETDFSSLTADEWRQLVTPDLHFRHEIVNPS
ncbi:hypothetical protein QBC38DRAFT_240715 [Podospora fimiseda]|uniref:Uncharacterized protein n=1 Tax=Podospora fimiseda TaxID=252190 RepID=A0AAN7H0A8_9PEZI|nr:hypothetical protein QBC38DRAFT_240715 [Podospora fimiseda]